MDPSTASPVADARKQPDALETSVALMARIGGCWAPSWKRARKRPAEPVSPDPRRQGSGREYRSMMSAIAS